ncbi:uncharacterized protein LOC129799519 [Phlebotomus papatasi]|uniref:uncharacterized protein LOC129799519 n=1 Tax=Phlebotomus papatasi TaxID=29031 RepID=UPI0024845A95|nr:uncharacterized protein LOC129799519 [Phlebotomus papatasi]
MFYIGLAPFVPTDFNRKPRSFDDLCHWKATEFRLFGFYTGLLVAHDFFPDEYYKHFLLYFCAIRLMSTSDITPEDISLARDFLNSFVQEYADFYERRSVTYNVHALLHLPEIVEVYGSLDTFSAYRFENFLQHIKRKITKKHQILPQLYNRMEEEFAIMPLKTCGNPSYSDQFRLTTPYFGANFAYRTCIFSTYEITANERDGCCEIDNNFAISIVGFCDYDGVKGVIGRRYQDHNPFFLSPVNSTTVGIYKVTTLADDADFYAISRITGKFMRLPHQNTIVLIKLLHENMTE